jgi:hypothetical protein
MSGLHPALRPSFAGEQVDALEIVLRHPASQADRTFTLSCAERAPVSLTREHPASAGESEVLEQLGHMDFSHSNLHRHPIETGIHA